MIPITYVHMLTSAIMTKARRFLVFLELGVTDFWNKGQIKECLTG